MQDSIIEKLYYGNISPFERSFSQNSEYRKALNESADIREELEKTLNDAQKKMLDNYSNANAQCSAHIEFLNFIDGFSLASKIIFEALTYKN